MKAVRWVSIHREGLLWVAVVALLLALAGGLLVMWVGP